MDCKIHSLSARSSSDRGMESDLYGYSLSSADGRLLLSRGSLPFCGNNARSQFMDLGYGVGA